MLFNLERYSEELSLGVSFTSSVTLLSPPPLETMDFIFPIAFSTLVSPVPFHERCSSGETFLVVHATSHIRRGGGVTSSERAIISLHFRLTFRGFQYWRLCKTKYEDRPLILNSTGSSVLRQSIFFRSTVVLRKHIIISRFALFYSCASRWDFYVCFTYVL